MIQVTELAISWINEPEFWLLRHEAERMLLPLAHLTSSWRRLMRLKPDGSKECVDSVPNDLHANTDKQKGGRMPLLHRS